MTAILEKSLVAETTIFLQR